ncbi:MAG: polysaccharide deacetylase family protein [Clostridia bacterium]|nr:polysaccharide deacetylase family protein [Clostridia bacterium]
MHRVVFNRFPGGVSRCLTMSYDDGRKEDVRLVEIFNKNGIKGTFHLNSGFFCRDNVISFEDVKDLYKGHEVSCHMATHPWPTIIPETAKLAEIYEDRKALEKACGYPVRGMSYPYGNFDDETIKVIKNTGIEYSRTVHSTNNFDIPEDFLRWDPTCHHRHDIVDKIPVFLDPGRDSHYNLFYVWGHSYEFSHNNNWELIEEFCAKISGLENVWYATNIEIVDYINATKSLRMSLELDSFYNPSAISVWLTVDGQTLEIPAGTTVKI